MKPLRCLFVLYAASVIVRTSAADGRIPRASAIPYPRSAVIKAITWHWETYTNAALGSDLWPVTWGADEHLYTAWGDGGGFGGSDTDSRVAMGFGRIEGTPPHWRGINVNGGKNPEHPASFPRKGKTAGLACVDGVLYAAINLQDGPWPYVRHVLAWSTNVGATWSQANWTWPNRPGSFQPATFLNFEKDYDGVPDALKGYVYIYGPKIPGRNELTEKLFLARVPRGRIREAAAYEFFSGIETNGGPGWSAEAGAAQAVFTDPHGVSPGSAVYDTPLNRYLLACFHAGPGQLGVFEAPTPWGPWDTVDYEEAWGGMGTKGEGLTCSFPRKWMSADGLTLWTIFSVYGEGGKKGVHAHDRFNLLKATLNR